MSQVVYLQPSFVLHTRPYRETSVLVSLFTRDYGRVDAIARGVRRLKSPLKGLLQPFQCLQINWAGRHDLVTLKDAELTEPPVNLNQQALMLGLYLNELLVRLLAPHDAHEKLFNHYLQMMSCLRGGQLEELALRQFEKQLLQELGFGLPLDKDYLGQVIHPDAYYEYQPDIGFRLAVNGQPDRMGVFLGANLHSIEQESLTTTEQLKSAKHLMRLAIHHLLQYKPIRSREMFQ